MLVDEHTLKAASFYQVYLYFNTIEFYTTYCIINGARMVPKDLQEMDKTASSS